MLPEWWVVRHGRTEWSVSGRHTGRTDVPLTHQGRADARALASVLGAHRFALVLTSPMARARETAALAGFADAEVEPNLREWDYGDFEGMTMPAIRAHPEWTSWTVWTHDPPGGETIEQVAARAAAVLSRVEHAAGDALLFGHGHQLRVLTALALELDARAGARFVLDPGTVSVIGSERESRALRQWNLAPFRREA